MSNITVKDLTAKPTPNPSSGYYKIYVKAGNLTLLDSAGNEYTLSGISLPLSLANGGLGANASAWDGFLRVSGGGASAVKAKLDATAAPAATNDSSQGYDVGSVWVDVTNDDVYMCVDATVSAAVWEQLNGSGAGSFTLAGDAGTPQTISTGDTLTVEGGAGITTTTSATDKVTIAVDSNVVTLSAAQTLTNKTIDGDDNTIQDLALSSMKTVAANANRFLTRDASGAVVDNANPTVDGGLVVNGEVVINDAGANTDTRVEGDSDPNVLFIDASEDSVGVGTATPHTSAKLDVVSTSKGLGLPSMTTTQRNAISSPRDGLLVYDSTEDNAYLRAGGVWQSLNAKISYAQIVDEKATGTHGGDAAAGVSAWATRILNTIKHDPDGIVSLSSNQFTLEAGKYVIKVITQIYRYIGGVRHRIYNVTDASVVAYGDSVYKAIDTLTTHSFVECFLDISSAKTFRLEHRNSGSASTTDFGRASNITGVNEIYTIVSIWKVG